MKLFMKMDKNDTAESIFKFRDNPEFLQASEEGMKKQSGVLLIEKTYDQKQLADAFRLKWVIAHGAKTEEEWRERWTNLFQFCDGLSAAVIYLMDPPKKYFDEFFDDIFILERIILHHAASSENSRRKYPSKPASAEI